MNHPTYDPKDPAESLPLGIDFADQLEDDETLSTQAFTSSVLTAGVADSSPLELSAGGVSGSIAQTTVAGGTHGIVYKLRAVVTTSAGRTLVACGILPVETC